MNSCFIASKSRVTLLIGCVCLLSFFGCNTEEDITVAPQDNASFYEQMDEAGISEEMLPRNVSLAEDEKEILLDFVQSEDFEFIQIENQNGTRNVARSIFLFRFSVFLTGISNDVRPEELTAFAPINEAFINDLGIRNLIGLIREPRGSLRTVINYHIALGAFRAADLSNGFFPTRNGAAVEVNLREGVMINQANVIATDLRDTRFFPNGVLHVIDGILIPPTQNIVEIAIGAAPEFSILVEAVIEAGLAETLAEEGPWTVFAPTNEAFTNLLNSLEAAPDVETLRTILLYHVVEGRVYSSDLVNGPVNTLAGEIIINADELTIDDMGSDMDANLIPAALNIQGTNGVIHVIDKVLLP